MISPHTPPGTKVVALRTFGCADLGSRITEGQVYTVAKIVECEIYDPGDSPFAAVLQELEHRGFHDHIHGPIRQCIPIEYLRRLELPREITDALRSAPVDPVRQTEDA